jgi:hypothetical protein
MKNRNKFIAIITSIIILVSTSGCSVIKNNTGVNLTTETEHESIQTTETMSTNETEISTEYITNSENNVYYSYQRNSEWKDDNLGDSVYKMYDSGCLTCCLTSEIIMQGIELSDADFDINPKTMNEYFSENEVYDSEGNIQWDVLESVLGMTVVRKDAEEMETKEIENLLSDGIYPIVRVRVNGNGNYHYVLITREDNGGFWCMDPLNSEECEVSLDSFGNTIYAVRYLS